MGRPDDAPHPSWTWEVADTQHRTDSVQVTERGLQFWVDDFWDLHGGGFLTFEDFLAGGPMVERQLRGMPRPVRDEITHYVLGRLDE